MEYKNPVPVAVAVARVRRPDGTVALLGIIRKRAPAGGKALPGGYVDELESARMAAAREFREETRFVTQPAHWRLLAEEVSPDNRLLLFCELLCEIPAHQLEGFQPTQEVSGVLCISPEDTDLCFALHLDVAQSYLARAQQERYPEQVLDVDDSPQL